MQNWHRTCAKIHPCTSMAPRPNAPDVKVCLKDPTGKLSIVTKAWRSFHPKIVSKTKRTWRNSLFKGSHWTIDNFL